MTAGEAPPRNDQAAAVERFEREVLEQEPVAPEHYSDHYFTGEWRTDAGDNRYTVEARREAEARNPELIKEVFEPERVLDMGCGPGALMLFLEEIGVHADGVDISEDSKQLAPDEVRERIAIGAADDPTVSPARSYDLVICREVLEHLTVLEVRRTIANLCRISSRYVYATTRFHPDPADLLDFTTEFDIDPTHITVMSKDLVRALFVLEGFRRRPDLEERMDWLGKGRVLVYERTGKAV